MFVGNTNIENHETEVKITTISHTNPEEFFVDRWQFVSMLQNKTGKSNLKIGSKLYQATAKKGFRGRLEVTLSIKDTKSKLYGKKLVIIRNRNRRRLNHMLNV